MIDGAALAGESRGDVVAMHLRAVADQLEGKIAGAGQVQGRDGAKIGVWSFDKEGAETADAEMLRRLAAEPKGDEDLAAVKREVTEATEKRKKGLGA